MSKSYTLPCSGRPGDNRYDGNRDGPTNEYNASNLAQVKPAEPGTLAAVNAEFPVVKSGRVVGRGTFGGRPGPYSLAILAAYVSCVLLS